MSWNSGLNPYRIISKNFSDGSFVTRAFLDAYGSDNLEIIMEGEYAYFVEVHGHLSSNKIMLKVQDQFDPHVELQRIEIDDMSKFEMALALYKTHHVETTQPPFGFECFYCSDRMDEKVYNHKDRNDHFDDCVMRNVMDYLSFVYYQL